MACQRDPDVVIAKALYFKALQSICELFHSGILSSYSSTDFEIYLRQTYWVRMCQVLITIEHNKHSSVLIHEYLV